MTLEDAEAVYLALLAHPMDVWRIRNQRVLSIIRSHIAETTGRHEEEVQNYYEARARSAP